MRILICEDEVLLALDLSMILEEAGHEVVGTVDRSGECLGRCSADLPDLVLVDLTLADGPTGYDLASQLSGRGIDVVIVSAETSFVPKPVPRPSHHRQALP